MKKTSEGAGGVCSRRKFVLGEKLGIFSRIFGCAHTRLSKPVTVGKTSFQYCAECGARRQYDIENFKPRGAFYRPAIGENLYYI